MQLSKGWQYSAILHITILLLMIFGLPEFLHRHIDAEPPVISVEILPIAKESNVKPQEETPEKPEPKKPVEEKHTERKQTVEAAKPKTSQETPPKPEQRTPEPPIPVKAEEVVKKVEPPKKVEPKKVEKKVSKEEDLDSILTSVAKTAKSEESKKPTEAKQSNTKKAVSQNYDASKPLSMSEIDAIRQQIQQCWSPPIGAKDADNLIINLRINIAEDGTVTKVDLDSDESRYNSDSFFKAAADSAIRAVHKCSPLKNLPSDKYSTWSDITMTFNPKDMF